MGILAQIMHEQMGNPHPDPGCGVSEVREASRQPWSAVRTSPAGGAGGPGLQREERSSGYGRGDERARDINLKGGPGEGVPASTRGDLQAKSPGERRRARSLGILEALLG